VSNTLIHHPDKTEANLLKRYDALVDYASFTDEAYQWGLDQLGITITIADSVLDLGCGRGTFCHFVEKVYGVSAIGVDYSLKRIKAARQINKQSNTPRGARPRFVHSTLQDYLQRKSEIALFDFIALFEVLEHLDDPHRVLALAKQRAHTVFGSLPLNHPSESHIWDFPTLASIQDFLQSPAKLVQKPDSYRIFFVLS
jgi:2-polyprenyl-3-methyl-5-hydroxy-6-metoxy-1,4-benzoquinol methylase